MADKSAWLENARLKFDGRKCKAGKCRRTLKNLTVSAIYGSHSGTYGQLNTATTSVI